MKKRIGMLLMLLVVLTGCGVSQAEFEELAKRVEILESQQDTESTAESLVRDNELTSIGCRALRIGYYSIPIFNKIEEATENPVEVEMNLFSGMGNIFYDVYVWVDFFIPAEMENVAVKRYYSSSDNVNLEKHEVGNIVYVFCDEWSTADVPGSILYEVAYNGKTAYFAVKLK